MLKILIRVAISIAVVVGLVYGGVLLYTKVINPPEGKLNEDDLSAIVSVSSTAPSTDTESSTAPTSTLTKVRESLAHGWPRMNPQLATG